MKVNNITIIMIICIVTSGFHIKYRKKNKALSKNMGGKKRNKFQRLRHFLHQMNHIFGFINTHKKPPQYLNTIHLQIFFFESLYIIGNRSTNV